MPFHMVYPILWYMVVNVLALSFLAWRIERLNEKIDRLDAKLAEHLSIHPEYVRHD
jgi:hypothetical protein